MKILYLECGAGASGDMIMGALAGLFTNPSEAERILDSIGIPDVSITFERGSKSGISGIKTKVLIKGREEGCGCEKHEHSHRSLDDVLALIEKLPVSENVKRHATEIYRSIAEAESEVHGAPVGEVHFHEVGMLDAIADVVGACVLIEKLSPDTIISSPLRTGFGTVECAHGTLPVPAPATARLLIGMGSYAGDVEGEFTTPTGAAIIKHFSKGYAPRPQMSISALGYGLGRRDCEIPNMLRAFLGESSDAMPSVDVLSCNIDDMTAEDLGMIIDLLLSKGAKDATITPVIMKKGRPGQMLTCLCRHEDTDEMARTILANTSTIGLRIWPADRYEMASHTEICKTCYGDIRVKVSEGFGITKWKPEHDDLVKAAEAHGTTVRKVRDSVDFGSDR